MRDLQSEWERSGPQVLARLVDDDPATFARLVASVIPKDYNISVEVDVLDFAGKFRAALQALHGDEDVSLPVRTMKTIEHGR